MQKIGQAAIVVYLFDAVEFSPGEVLKDMMKLNQGTDIPVLPVANKIDVREGMESMNKFKEIESMSFVSAKNRFGITELKKRLYETVLNGRNINEGTILSNARHYEALQSTLKNLLAAQKGIETKLSGELVASDIRSALNHLGEITGEVTTDDLLGNIFGKFCIGK